MVARSDLARWLARKCLERSLSYAKLSLRAGLDSSYVSMVARGRANPKPRTLRRISDALGLSATDRAEFYRLAQSYFDPASTAEAKAARRDAWRPLTYILVNHVLLPRLQLGDMLAGKRPLSEPDRELIQQAANAPDIVSFVQAAAETPPPSRRLAKRLEATFHDVSPDAVAHLQRNIKNAISTSRPWGPNYPAGVPYRWDERWAVGSALLSFNRPERTEVELFNYLHRYGFDYNFAVCFFPAVYWHACHDWPFEKVVMPYARRPPDVQRRLYDATRTRLSVEDLAATLIGAGSLGAGLARIPPGRPSPNIAAGAAGEDWVELAVRGKGRTFFPTGPAPPTDALFDHLDRCEFLGRFPLVKIDRAGFSHLARSLELPSWTAWTDFVAERWNWPLDQPPRSRERFQHVIPDIRRRDADEDEPKTLDSYIARRLSEEAAESMARLLGKGDWQRAAAAARSLGFRPAWLQLTEALANARRR